MSAHQLVFLIALLVPLSIDTFVLSAALGLAGLPKKQQVRTSAILASFEAGMPVAGAIIGHGIGGVLGGASGYIAGVVIALAGAFMLKPGEEQKEENDLKLLQKTSGWSVISLGLAISIDGLAVGLSLGVIKVSLVSIVIGMAILAFVASIVGLKIGARLGKRLRENAEKLAGIILVAVGLLMIVLKLTGHSF